MKNAGFIRVDERRGQLRLEICVRKLIRSHEKGKVYALMGDSPLIGVELGEVGIINGQGDVLCQMSSSDIMGSRFTFSDIVGVGIRFPNNGYLASCWKDEDAKAIGREDFVIYKEAEEAIAVQETKEDVVMQEQDASADEMLEELMAAEEMLAVEEEPQESPQVETAPPVEEVLPAAIYQKIELNQIRTLPSPNWYLCNNSFLVHGFFNYGHLVLKKKMENDQETNYLGVPGIFEKPEMVMAILFGFPDFQALPEEMRRTGMNVEMELPEQRESQEPKEGTFGCWLIPLQ